MNGFYAKTTNVYVLMYTYKAVYTYIKLYIIWHPHPNCLINVSKPVRTTCSSIKIWCVVPKKLGTDTVTELLKWVLLYHEKALLSI